jgi:hypothetical protein
LHINVFKYLIRGALFPNGIPFPTTPLGLLCRIFAPVATGLRVLRMFTGSVIDLAPFVPQLPEMACKEALGSPLTWIVHPQTNGQDGQPALFPLRPFGLLLDSGT